LPPSKRRTEAYNTTRGTVLGWFDAINYIAVAAILDSLIDRGIPIDFIGFNDDVEISIYKDNCEIAETLNILRDVVIMEISSYDILISLNKTYGSKASVFLERYNYFTEKYELDMYKLQLTIKAYSRSMVAKEPWRAKMLYASASEWTPDAYCRDRCIDTIGIEFRQEEVTLPIEAGGWHVFGQGNLNTCLRNCDKIALYMIQELQKWRPPNLSKKPKERDSVKIAIKGQELSFKAQSSDMMLHISGFETNFEDINFEDGAILNAWETHSGLYTGMTEWSHIYTPPRRLFKSSGVQPPPE
jgi:hypothetical protein